MLNGDNDNVDKLVHGYNQAFMITLDPHEPATVKTCIIWYKKSLVGSLCLFVKQQAQHWKECRCWRKSGLEADHQLYMEAQQCVTDIIKKNRK